MMSITEYFIFWSLVFCASGAFVYILDFWGGKGVRKWWHDMTYENPLAEAETRGFFHRSSLRTRLRAAAMTGVVGSILVATMTEFRPIAELFLWIACIPAVFAGLWLGPFVCRLWQSREKAIHALEEMEEHGINIQGGAQTVLHHVQEGLHMALKHVHPAHTEPNKSQVSAPEKPKIESDEPTQEEIRAMMDKYTSGRNS